jgi:hypothetical protein
VHQCGKYSLFVGRVVVGPGVKVETGMGRFTVHSMAQRTVESPININVKKGKVALSFVVHGELNALVDTVQVVQEVLWFVGSVWPYSSSSTPCSQTSSVCVPQYQRPSFTPIQNHRHNYSFVHSNFYVFRKQTRRQKALE